MTDLTNSNRTNQIYIVGGVCIAYFIYVLVTCWLPRIIQHVNLTIERRRALVSVNSDPNSIDAIKSDLRHYKHETACVQQEEHGTRKQVNPKFTLPSRPSSGLHRSDVENESINSIQEEMRPGDPIRPTFSLQSRKQFKENSTDENASLVSVDEVTVPFVKKKEDRNTPMNTNVSKASKTATSLSSFREGSIEAQLHAQLRSGGANPFTTSHPAQSVQANSSRVADSSSMVEQERSLRRQQEAEYRESIERDLALRAEADKSKVRFQ